MIITFARATVMAPHHVARVASRWPSDYLKLGRYYQSMTYDTERSRISRLSRSGVRLIKAMEADRRSQRVKLVTAAPELAFACIFVFEYLDRDIYNDILETYPEDWEKAWKSLKP